MASAADGDMNGTQQAPTFVPTSASATSSHSPAPSLPPPTSQSSLVNGSNPHTPPPANCARTDAPAGEAAPAPSSSPNSNSSFSAPVTPASPADQDRQIIIEALKGKDRIYVLKLGEQMESMIKERRQRVDLQPATSYQRLLVHRCSAYYKLAPESDPITKGISVLVSPDSRIPEVRICELVPPESTSQPAFKIMRRSTDRRKAHSQAGSVAGEDADLSDVEPSEAGSLGGRSNATGSSSKKGMTLAEREAAYQQARSRIFMDFEEKEKVKESQMSASSSSLSLNSTSASTSANGDASSTGDIDGSVSSPATESEWSVPVTRERKDNRRGNAAASSSCRSIRSGGTSYGSNNSSRNSRASSPSFTYPSLYEPAPTGQLYDPNQPANSANPQYHGTQYYHPFAPPPAPAVGVYVQYPPYYAPYPYQSPPPDLHNTESSHNRGMEQQYPPAAMNYGSAYMWPHHGQQPPQGAAGPQSLPTSPHHPHPAPGHPMSPPPSQPYGYAQPPYTYPPTAYYPPQQTPGQAMASPPAPSGMQQSPIYDGQRGGPGPGGNGSASAPPHSYHAGYAQNARGTLSNGALPQQHPGGPGPRGNQRNGNPGFTGNGNKRGAPTGARSAWSYGPGAVGHTTYSPSSGSVNGDSVGPRFTTSRRQSNNSTSSSYSRTSSNNDDVSSIASSSTTSSSSRRTYTSTASSQHPLPARPDWAVGLKAQPTLASPRDSPSRHPSLPISPARSASGSTHSLTRGTPPLVLQPNDFPPLTPQALSGEKRPVGPTGAWGNAATRSILSPPRSEDGADKALQKNGGATAANSDSTGHSSNRNLTEHLVNQIQSISIEEKIAAVELASTNSMMVISSASVSVSTSSASSVQGPASAGATPSAPAATPAASGGAAVSS